MENNKPQYINVMVIYTIDENGNKKYDYQEMAEHFAFNLWLLDRDNDVDVNVNTSGYSDDWDDDDDYFGEDEEEADKN